MAGKFEVYEDKAGKFRFRLKAGNGEIVAVGEAYDTMAAAQEGCAAVLLCSVPLTVRASSRPTTRKFIAAWPA